MTNLPFRQESTGKSKEKAMSNDVEQALKCDREFVSSVVRQLPKCASSEIKQGWIENPQGLQTFLLGLGDHNRASGYLSEFRKGVVLPERIKESGSKGVFAKRCIHTAGGFSDLCLEDIKSVASMMKRKQVMFQDILHDVSERYIYPKLHAEYTFQNLDAFLPFFFGLFDNQRNGEHGDLLTNGRDNIFFVLVGEELFSISLGLNIHSNEWHCDADLTSEYDRSEGERIFSAREID